MKQCFFFIFFYSQNEIANLIQHRWAKAFASAAKRLSFSKFKFVAIFQSHFAEQIPSSVSFPYNNFDTTHHTPYQDTDFSSQYLSRHRFDFPSSSSSFVNSAYMSTSSSNSLVAGGNNAGTNLIVNYLPQDMTDRELYSLFRHSGPIESCRVMRDFKVNLIRTFFCFFLFFIHESVLSWLWIDAAETFSNNPSKHYDVMNLIIFILKTD